MKVKSVVAEPVPIVDASSWNVYKPSSGISEFSKVISYPVLSSEIQSGTGPNGLFIVNVNYSVSAQRGNYTRVNGPFVGN